MSTLSGQSFLQRIEAGDVTAVINLLQSTSINIEERDENGQSFLMCACQLGSQTVVNELLEKGADVNTVDNDNWSALLNAAKEGFCDIVVTLLDAGASINHRDMGGWTALMWACYKGHTDVAQVLLDRGSSPNNRGEHRVPAIIWAAGRGHAEIVRMLLNFGAKVNTTDKYGTTPLIWAARKGYCNVVEVLLSEGAHVDTAGMNSWTALLVSCKGGYTDCVRAILEHNPNVNAVDKDGLTSLAIAAKEGHVEIVKDLLEKGAYVNVTDMDNDSVLIRAVKGGHYEIVHALLKKSADVDHMGTENKTALFWAVEKNNLDIVKLLLKYNPDLEIQSKDGSTVLLKAVKNRNIEVVHVLLDKGGKPSAVDKRGDNALHICLRARHRKLAELLLRNPKESRLLYRQNTAGETPYNLDTSHKRSILTQIFGARHLNAAELSENLLGYDLYSSSLADVLSEPTMHTPMTVGLFAKWGSGKSFLLSRLQDEMKSFAQRPQDIYFEFSLFLFFLVVLFSCVMGLSVGFLAWHWQAGIGVGAGLFMFLYMLLGMLWFVFNYKDWTWADKVSMYVGRKICSLSLLLQVLFCNQPQNDNFTRLQTTGIRFLFTEKTKLTSVGGEKSIAAMIGTLSDSVENTYGFIVTRLFRAFGPSKSTDGRCSRYKGVCCLPYFIVAIFELFAIIVGIGLLIKFGVQSKDVYVNGTLIALATITGIILIANVYNWAQVIACLASSQQRRIMQAAKSVDMLKTEGFLQVLKSEISLMVRTVRCMDSFTGNQTRLVVILDGLDSCEQEKVMLVLDMVHNLFCDADAPFITLLAVDPHIIIKGIESNLHQVFHDSSINGHDYLRNIVHLPFYLQSQGLPRPESSESPVLESSPQRGASRMRQDSTYSSYSALNSGDNKQHKKHLKSTGSVNFGTGSNALNLPSAFGSTVSRPPSVMDLSKSVIKNDYFSDVNPRSMRRLMNIVAITGRLLRAYNIDFSWYRLSAWINISEQWPYRTSWILLHFQEQEDTVDETLTLKDIYDRVIDRIPLSKDIDPLMEIDRNPRKFEAFLTSHTPMLNVGDIKRFLPCTISLDPYLRKLIKEMSQQNEQMSMEYGPFNQVFNTTAENNGTLRRRASPVYLTPQHTPLKYGSLGRPQQSGSTGRIHPSQQMYSAIPPHMQQMMMAQRMYGSNPMMALPSYGIPPHVGLNPTPPLAKVNIETGERLSSMSVDSVCQLLPKLQGIDSSKIDTYTRTMRESNISGPVLSSCDLDELKQVMLMSFGDWQIFRTSISSLREQEMVALMFEENSTCPVADEHQSVICQPESHSASKRLSGAFDQVDTEPRMRTNSFGQPSPRPDSYSQQNTPRSRSGSMSSYQQRKLSRETSSGSQVKIEEKRSLPRKDSVMQQIMMENMLLRDVMDDFTNGHAAVIEAQDQQLFDMDKASTPLNIHLGSDEEAEENVEDNASARLYSPDDINAEDSTKSTGTDEHNVKFDPTTKQVSFEKSSDHAIKLKNKHDDGFPPITRPKDLKIKQSPQNSPRGSLKSTRKAVTFEEDSESSDESCDERPLIQRPDQKTASQRRDSSPVKMIIANSLEKLYNAKEKLSNVIVHHHKSPQSQDSQAFLLDSIDMSSQDSIMPSPTTVDINSSESVQQLSTHGSQDCSKSGDDLDGQSVLAKSNTDASNGVEESSKSQRTSRFTVTRNTGDSLHSSRSTSRDSSLTRSPRDGITNTLDIKIDMDK